MQSQLNSFPISGGSSITQVSFSRDGQWVTYLSYPEREVWRSRVDGTEKLQLTRAPLDAWAPTFSSDGRQILFNAFGAGEGRGCTWFRQTEVRSSPLP